MALPKSDNFNRANEALVGNGYAEVQQASSGSNFHVNTNVCSWNGTTGLGQDCCVRDSDNTYNASHKATVTITDLTSGSSFQRIGPAVRCQSGDSSYNGFRVKSQTGGDSGFEWQLIEVVSGGSASVLSSGSDAYAVNDTLTLEVSGSTLTAKINGVQVGTGTSGLTNGYAGICGRNVDGISVDNAAFDDLGGGGGGSGKPWQHYANMMGS